MFKNIDYPKLIVSVVGCELAGILGTPFTIEAIPTWYANLDKPLFAPPNWVFGPVWTLLYFLMGVSLYLVWKKGIKNKKVRIAIKFFFAQLLLNFLWSIAFFGLKSPELGLVNIIAMWILIVITMMKFKKISATSFYLLIPYLLWVSFATILNLAIAQLN